MKLRSNARTDVGRTRDHNEDSFGSGEGPVVADLGELLVVCDGMGGHAAGEVASELAVRTILENYYADPSDERPEALEHAFHIANERVYRQGRGTMGTTGVAALLVHDALHIANVGDSRAYLIRKGTIRQITRDHSYVSDQMAAGLLTPEQARVSAHRNIITRAIGHQADVTVDLFRWPLQIGDIVLLCSDGLHGLVEDEEILAFASNTPLEQLPQQLISLANERGGFDNITVFVSQVEALDWDAQPVEDDTPPAPIIDPSEQITEQIEPISQAAAVEPTPQAAASAPQPATPERRLSLLGGLLAALVLTALLFSILFVYLGPATNAAPTTIATVVTTIQPTPLASAVAATAIAPPNPTTAATSTSAATTNATTAPTTAARTPTVGPTATQ